MSLKITKGLKPTAVRGVIYGVEGVGKSSLAALLPEPLFLDLEEGTHQLDVARASVDSFIGLQSSLAHLATDNQGFKTLIIDSADWAERLCSEAMLKKQGKKSIEDFGFGKGFVMLAEEMARTLEACDTLVHRGMNVVWVAHAKTVRVSPPDMVDGFDRFELKMAKQVAPLFKEWADVLIFANYETLAVKGNDGRIKGGGGQNRFLHTERNSAWDAKNRYGLPAVLPMVRGELPAELAAVFAGKIVPVAPVSAPEAPASQPERVASTTDQHGKLATYSQNSVARPIIEKALEHYHAMGFDDLSEAEAEKVIARCQEEMNKVAESAVKPAQPAGPAFPWPAPVKAWLKANETKVNAFLVAKQWIAAGQTFLDLHHERAEKLIEKADAFAKSAGIPAMSVSQKEVAA
jgi:hypothetical protein